jgi:large subunit ribosomal protein L10
MVQPKPKQMSREEKEEKVAEFKRKIEDYPVIGVLDMQSLPSRQLQQMKKEMKEFADIKMSRKTLMQIAIEKAEKDDIEQLEDNEAVQPAFIFSDKDPFQLYSLIKKNKTSAAAQGGETSPSDIEVPEGNTGIGPGPMLGKLQQTGAQVQVDDGSIHVMQSATMIEKGDTITADDAEILNQLGIEPLEIGLDLDIAFSDGEIFTAEQLDIDEEEYRDNIESAAGLAFNLAVNAGIVNETTAGTIVGEAAQKGRNLSISEGIPTEDTIEEILAHASSNAEGLDSQVDTEDVDLEESEEPEEPEDSGEESEDEDDDNDSEEDSGDSDSSEEKEE